MSASFYDKTDQDADNSNIRKLNKTNNPTSFFDSDEDIFSIKIVKDKYLNQNIPVNNSNKVFGVPSEQNKTGGFGNSNCSKINNSASINDISSGNSISKINSNDNFDSYDCNYNKKNRNGSRVNISEMSLMCSADGASSHKTETMLKRHKESELIAAQTSSNPKDEFSISSAFEPNKRLEASLLELDEMYQKYVDLYSECRDKLNFIQEECMNIKIRLLDHDIILMPKVSRGSQIERIDYLREMSSIMMLYDEMTNSFKSLDVNLIELEEEKGEEENKSENGIYNEERILLTCQK